MRSSRKSNQYAVVSGQEKRRDASRSQLVGFYDLYPDFADNLQKSDMLFWPARDEFDVGRVGGKLMEDRVYRHPLSQPYLGPGVIVERAVEIYHTCSHSGGESSRTGQGSEQHCMFVTVPSLAFQSFQSGGHTDRRDFVEGRIRPVEEPVRRFLCVVFSAKDLLGLGDQARVGTLEKWRRRQIGGELGVRLR